MSRSLEGFVQFKKKLESFEALQKWLVGRWGLTKFGVSISEIKQLTDIEIAVLLRLHGVDLDAKVSAKDYLGRQTV